MTTTFEPTQVTFEIDAAGSSVVSALSSTQVWGPGQGYPYTWDRFLTPSVEQPGTWRAVRYNWRTGGVVLQLGTQGNFGPAATVQAGWVRRHFSLGAGRNDLRITFRMGPVTERPNPQVARGQVFARLVPNIPYVPSQVATAQLPAGGVVNLDLTTFIPGANYDLYVGCIGLITTPQVNPYCEVIVNDIKVQHTLSPYPYLTEGGDETRGAEKRGLQQLRTPDGVELPKLDDALRFDDEDLQVVPLDDEPAADWVGLEG